MSLSSLLQFQIIKEPHSEEHLVNARCKLSLDNLHLTLPEITKSMFKDNFIKLSLGKKRHVKVDLS